jgi:ABC-type dipeptide/oligopeptide/nickel transport system permease subunit
MASLVYILLVVVLAIFSPLVTSADYTAMRFEPLAAPSWAHIFGTDNLGRDLWSRVVYGARISLEVGLGSQAIALAVGLVVGSVSGFFGRLADALLMRMTDVMLALPALLFALLFITVFGNSTGVLVLAIGFATWPVIARIVRSQVLQVKNYEFVEAAYSVGATRRRVLLVHILPNTMGPVIVQITFGVSQAIFTEAFLAFIGLGAQPPSPSWGRLLVDGFEYVRTSPHLVIFPGIAISLTLLAFNFLGDGLRDAFDPHYHS